MVDSTSLHIWAFKVKGFCPNCVIRYIIPEIFTVGPLAQELDALIERARGESLEQQKVTYREIQAFLAEQVPQLVIASRPKIAGAGNHVQGLALSPLSPNYYYETVWLEQ